MPKKTLTKTKLNTKIISKTAIIASVFVLLTILAGLSYGMFIKYKGQKNKANAEQFFQQYLKPQI